MTVVMVVGRLRAYRGGKERLDVQDGDGIHAQQRRDDSKNGRGMSGEAPDAFLLQMRVLVIVVGRGRLDILDERLHICTLHWTTSSVVREDGDVRRRSLPWSSPESFHLHLRRSRLSKNDAACERRQTMVDLHRHERPRPSSR